MLLATGKQFNLINTSVHVIQIFFLTKRIFPQKRYNCLCAEKPFNFSYLYTFYIYLCIPYKTPLYTWAIYYFVCLEKCRIKTSLLSYMRMYTFHKQYNILLWYTNNLGMHAGAPFRPGMCVYYATYSSRE